jgi:CHAT domain-containing protein
MSLSRAFAFAGCSNIIMSLWMADDLTTSYLTRRLHHYLDKGDTKDRALRAAKLDLIRDPAIDPRFKTPNYWGHLMFIGDYEREKRDPAWIFILSTLLAAGVAYLLFKRLKG